MPFIEGNSSPGGGGSSSTYIPRAPSPYAGSSTQSGPTGSTPLVPGFQNALQLYQQFYGPQNQTLANQQAQQLIGIGQAQQAYGQQGQALNNTYANQLAQLGLQQQGNQIDQSAVGRQSSYYDQLYGLDQQDTGRNIGYQNQLSDFLNQQYGVTTGVHSSTLQQLLNQASQFKNQAGRQVEDNNSSNAATGSYTSQGHRQQDTRTSQDLAYQLANNSQQTKQENLGFLGATIEKNKGQAGITNTIAGLSSDLTRSGLSHSEQEAQLQDRGQQLQLQAQGFGLTGEQYANTLQSGLASLNLNQAVTIGQLMDAASSTDMQRQQLAIQIIQQALSAGLYQ